MESQLSLFDLPAFSETRRRRSNGRIKRAKSKTLNVFRSFLVECKRTLDKGIKFNTKKLQNQFHVGHFPKSYIPFTALRKMSIAEIDLGFSRKIYREIQKYNKDGNRKIDPNYIRPKYTRPVKQLTPEDWKKQQAVKMIDSAITELQKLRNSLFNIINS